MTAQVNPTQKTQQRQQQEQLKHYILSVCSFPSPEHPSAAPETSFLSRLPNSWRWARDKKPGEGVEMVIPKQPYTMAPGRATRHAELSRSFRVWPSLSGG